jgi:hypothetical protein
VRFIRNCPLTGCLSAFGRSQREKFTRLKTKVTGCPGMAFKITTQARDTTATYPTKNNARQSRCDGYGVISHTVPAPWAPPLSAVP